MARQLVVDRFVGTAGDLSWKVRVRQDMLRTGRERYMDYPEVQETWERLTGATAVCDAPAFTECAVCGGCK